jgi:hypothetical protein
VAVDRDWRWTTWAIGIGGLMVVFGLALGLGSLRHVLHGERADGEVVEMRREGVAFAPIVRFGLPGGGAQEFKGVASNAPDLSVGGKVAILYMPQNPRDIRINTFDRLWFSPIIVTLLGTSCLLIGTVAWALSRDADLFLIAERTVAAIAVIAGLIGVFVLWSAADLYAGSSRAEGIVYGSDKTTEPASSGPFVRFKTHDGRELEFQGWRCSAGACAPGERVTVMYDPIHPVRARIASVTDIWLPAVVSVAVAAFFSGVLLILRRMRWAKVPPA